MIMKVMIVGFLRMLHGLILVFSAYTQCVKWFFTHGNDRKVQFPQGQYACEFSKIALVRLFSALFYSRKWCVNCISRMQQASRQAGCSKLRMEKNAATCLLQVSHLFTNSISYFVGCIYQFIRKFRCHITPCSLSGRT